MSPQRGRRLTVAGSPGAGGGEIAPRQVGRPAKKATASASVHPMDLPTRPEARNVWLARKPGGEDALRLVIPVGKAPTARLVCGFPPEAA